MKILIIEDEALAARQLQAMIEDYEEATEVLAVLDSVEAGVQWFHTHPAPDLLLADIELVDGQSFDIFSQVEVTCPVIFTTAYDEFALRAFQVNSVDYLLKPLNEEALRRSLRKFSELQRIYGKKAQTLDLKALLESLRTVAPATETYRDRFLLKQGSRLMPLAIGEIAYFFSSGRLTFVKTWDNRSLSLDYPLDELEGMLNPKLFYRANRQFIISARAVEKVHLHFNNRLKIDLKPAPDEEVFISRNKATEFRTWMGE